MPLTPEQIEEIKAQLREQVQHLPSQQKQAALLQIEQMSPEALESLVQQQQSKNQSGKEEKTIFRMIVDSDIPTVKIDENRYALAVLDINPISKAHIIIIPKKPVSDSKSLPTQSFSLAKKLAKKIELKFKAHSIDIITEKKFNEFIINLLPSYDHPLSLSSPRTKSLPDDLESLAKQLRPKKRIPLIRIKSLKAKEKHPLHLPRRIP